MKYVTLSLIGLLSAASLLAQQSTSEDMRSKLQQEQQQLEQQEQRLEQQLQQSTGEERQQLQEQKQQLQRQKRQLEKKLERQGQQSSSQASQSRSEASKDELKVGEAEARKEVTDINKASKVIGMKVMNKENEEVGEIKDLAVDVTSGKIAYAVLSSGGTLGVGEKLIAVPVESLTPMQGQEGFIIDAQKDRLSQAAGFTEKDWPKIDAADDSTVGLTPTGRPSEPKENN